MKQILGFLLILTCSSVCFGKVFLHYDFTNADENKDFKVDRMHPDDPAKNAYISPPDGYITNDYGVYLSGNSHILIPMNEFEKKNNFGIFLKYQFNMYIDATYLVYETEEYYALVRCVGEKFLINVGFDDCPPPAGNTKVKHRPYLYQFTSQCECGKNWMSIFLHLNSESMNETLMKFYAYADGEICVDRMTTPKSRFVRHDGDTFIKVTPENSYGVVNDVKLIEGDFDEERFIANSKTNMEPAFEYEDENPVYKKYDESQLIDSDDLNCKEKTSAKSMTLTAWYKVGLEDQEPSNIFAIIDQDAEESAQETLAFTVSTDENETEFEFKLRIHNRDEEPKETIKFTRPFTNKWMFIALTLLDVSKIEDEKDILIMVNDFDKVWQNEIIKIPTNSLCYEFDSEDKKLSKLRVYHWGMTKSQLRDKMRDECQHFKKYMELPSICGCIEPGFYLNEKEECEKCHANCNSCVDNTLEGCTSCKVLASHDTKECMTECTDLTTYSSISGQCDNCYEWCASCIGSDRTQCLTCKPDTPFELYYDGVTVTCTDYCTNGLFGNLRTHKCQDKCPHNTYPDEKLVCRECNDLCDGCTGPSNLECINCRKGTFKLYVEEYEAEICVETCPKHQYGSLETGRCEECHDHCIECFGPTEYECNGCIEGVLRYGDHGCLTKCPPGFYFTYENTCVDCRQICKNCRNQLSKIPLSCPDPNKREEYKIDYCYAPDGYEEPEEPIEPEDVYETFTLEEEEEGEYD